MIVTTENNLKTWCSNNGEFGQQLIKEWAGLDENNQPISMDSVKKGSNKKVKWKCLKGHEWYARIKDRTLRKHGCPYCSGNYVTEQNSLKTWCSSNGNLGQQLISEWAGQDENNQPISMDSIASASNKKVKWKCLKGHEWYATITSRTHNMQRCPYCSSKIITTENNLKTWCSNNGDFGQQLIQEWTGFDENNQPISMNNITRGSNKKVKWRCKQRHEWYATILSRTHGRTGCPYCYKQSQKGTKPGKVSLLNWCLNHGEYGQQLMSEWTPRVNGKPSGMDLISYGSETEATWKCKNGHTWKATINSRTGNRIGCPYCSGRRAAENNSLKTWCSNSGKLGQQLIREWTGEDENNQPISMDSVSYGSSKNVKWRCERGHEWYAKIGDRTRSLKACPYCAKLARFKEQRK